MATPSERKGKRYPIITALAILAGFGIFLGGAGALWMKFISPHSFALMEERFGVIPVEGIISDSQEIVSELVRLRKDDGIKAVILRINSPGGAVGPAQEICAEIKKVAGSKPVVASLGTVAASGGYYIAAPARMIVANPGTITGSIGVLMQFVRVEDLLNKVGIQLEVLKAGEYKDMGSPHRRLTESEKQMIQDLMADVRMQFVEEVARGRNLSVEKVNGIADGRIFSGAKAKELGLVDRLGTLEDAVELAKELAGVKGEISLVYPKKPRLRLSDFIGTKLLRTIYRLIITESHPKISYLWMGLPGISLSESY
ncbi:MAG: signal peptide peptidase SppA [Desulfobacteraceae bacterium]|jgi:protease-4|nr:MAG: signal peptide peptidase SppA [Desulfobacteraceae bacterium]